MILAKHILLVDDEALLREVMRSVLAAAGFDVEEAESGEEALGRLDRADFDLVVTDNSMKKMTGVELAWAIKRRLPSLPVVMLSGNPPRQRMACLDLVLQKPEDLPRLLDSVRRLLQSGTKRQAPPDGAEADPTSSTSSP